MRFLRCGNPYAALFTTRHSTPYPRDARQLRMIAKSRPRLALPCQLHPDMHPFSISIVVHFVSQRYPPLPRTQPQHPAGATLRASQEAARRARPDRRPVPACRLPALSQSHGSRCLSSRARLSPGDLGQRQSLPGRRHRSWSRAIGSIWPAFCFLPRSLKSSTYGCRRARPRSPPPSSPRRGDPSISPRATARRQRAPRSGRRASRLLL